MPFTFSFHTDGGMNAAQYDKVIKQLEAAGAGHPKGRLYHVCHGEPNSLHVTDVWDTMENFQEFGKVLMPILHELGVAPGEPVAEKVYNIIEDAVPA